MVIPAVQRSDQRKGGAAAGVEGRTIAIVPRASGSYGLYLVQFRGPHVTDLALLGDTSEDGTLDPVWKALQSRRIAVSKLQDWVLYLPRWDVIVRHLRLPTTNPDQIRLMAPYEVAGHLPWPREESVWAYEILAQHEDGASTLALYMARLEAVDAHLAALRRLHIHPTRVVPSVRGLAALLQSCVDAERPALMLVGSGGIEYLRLEGGVPAFSRGTPGTDDPTIVLTESISVDERRHGALAGSTSLYIAGADVGSFERAAQCPTEDALRGGAFHVLNGAAADTVEALQAVAAAVAPADALDTSNLLPPVEKAVWARRRLWRAVRKTALLALWFLAAAGVLGYFEYTVQVRAAESLERQLRELGPDIRALRDKNDALAYFADERRAAARPLEIVLELYEQTPMSVAINDFRYDVRGSVTLSGESPDFGSLFTLLQALDASPYFTECRLVTSTRTPTPSEPIVDFKINCQLAPWDSEAGDSQ